MIRPNKLLFLLLILFSTLSYGQVLITEETFDYPDGDTSGTMTGGYPWIVTQQGDCDFNVGDFNVVNNQFQVADKEGLVCCDCGSGAPGGFCGDNGSTVVFGPIDISGYFGVQIDFDFATQGQFECAYADCPDDPEPICEGGGGDQAIFSYRLDGGPLVDFAFWCGNQFCFGTDFVCGLAVGNSLEIIITAGTQTSSEIYFIDNITVEGFVEPLVVAEVNGSDNIGGPVQVCEGEDIELDETAGEAILWDWTGPSFSSMDHSPVIPNASSANNGTYTVVIQDAQGCTHFDTVIVEVIPEPSVNVSDVTACDSYTLTAITGTNLTGNEMYFDGSMGTGNSYSPGDMVTMSLNPMYVFDPTGTCDDEATFDIDITPSPTLDSHPDTTVCDSYTLPTITGTDLSGSEAYYTGTGGTGTTYAAGEMITSSVSPLYIYDANGTCNSEVSFAVTISASPSLDEPSDTTVCDSYTLPAITGSDLTGNEAYFTGMGGTGTSYDAGNMITANVNPLYIYDGQSGCEDEVSFNININITPSLDARQDTTACDAFTLPAIDGMDLTGNEGYFSGPGGTGTSYDVGDMITSSLNPMYIYDENGDCSDEISFDINIVNTPQIDPHADTTACDSYTLPAVTGTDLTGNEAYYEGMGGTGTSYDAGDMITSSISPLYIYDATGNCTDETSFNILINLTPEIDPLSDITVCDAYTLPAITGTNLTGNEAYFDMPDGGGMMFNPGSQITATATLYIYDIIGDCSDEVSFDVTVNTTEDASFDFDDFCEEATNGPTNISTPGGTFSFEPSPGDGATIDPSSGVISDGVGAATYNVQYIVAGACPDTQVVAVTVFENPTFTLDDVTCDPSLTSYTVDFTSDAGTVTSTAGSITDNGDGTFTIEDIPDGQDITITLEHSSNGCQITRDITAPDCSCPPIDPPDSDGDEEICEGEVIPELSVTVGAGLEVDWYDADVGGSLLASNTTTYTPTSAGTYWAETRDPASDCTSNTRIGVTLTIYPLPTFTILETMCEMGNTTYYVNFTTPADQIDIDAGILTDNGGGNYTVSMIPIGQDLTLTFTITATNCMAGITLSPPDCSCPNVPPPVSNGDRSICQGANIPALSVTVDPGLEVDWYDSPIGGTLLLSNSTTFIPTAAGTYFAEARDADGCTSNTRATIILTIHPLPTFTLIDIVCNSGESTAHLDLITTADIVMSNTGTVVDNGGGSYTIEDIPSLTVINLIFQTDPEGCEADTIFVGPVCDCPVINPPFSLGDQSICPGEPTPTLTVVPDPGLEVDWYDAESGGLLLEQGSSTFDPPGPGTYYAQARDPNNDCVSERTPVSFIVFDTLFFEVLESECIDPGTWQVILYTNADTILPNSGGVSGGMDTFLINGIDIDSTLYFIYGNTLTGCFTTDSIQMSCGCDSIPPPVSLGDTAICEGEDIPTLSVSVDTLLTVNWYDDTTGGNLVAFHSDRFTPDSGGIYYAQAVDTILDCVSNFTAVTLSINPLPTIEVMDIQCGPGPGTWLVLLSTNGSDLTVSHGLINGTGDTVLITEIPDTVDLGILISDPQTNCFDSINLPHPDCDCPMIPVPVPAYDTFYCAGSTIPSLAVLPSPGFITSWYDSVTGGNLLVDNSLTYTPDTAGIYFVENRDSAGECQSGRIAYELIEIEHPTFSVLDAECLTDTSYRLTIQIFADTFWLNGYTATGGSDSIWIVDSLPTDSDLSGQMMNFPGCITGLRIVPPDCSCPEIDPPIVADVHYECLGFPTTLRATAVTGTVVDWYDAQVGGTLLASATEDLIVNGPGIYYAESRDTQINCVSADRSRIEVIEFTDHRINFLDVECAPDNQSYTVLFTTGVDSVTVSDGILVRMNDTFEVSMVPIQINLLITAFDDSTGCQSINIVNPPDCNCPFVPPPLGGGTLFSCEGSPAPQFMTNSGIPDAVIDWYDDTTGGTLILAVSNVFTPTTPGDYWAETRDSLSNCSSSRVRFTWVQQPLPSIVIQDTFCSADLTNYSVVFGVSESTVQVNTGSLAQTGPGLFEVTNIPISNSLTIIATDTNSMCIDSMRVDPPNCDCPQIQAPVSGGDTSICAGSTIPSLEVFVPAGLTANWFDAATGGTLLAMNTALYQPTNGGSFWAETIDPSTNCVSSTRTEVQLIINPLPNVDAGLDIDSCGLIAQLSGVADATAMTQWTNSDMAIQISNPSALNPLVTSTQYGTFTTHLTATENGCVNVDSMVIQFSEGVSDSIHFDLCEGESITYNGTVYDESNPTGIEIIQGVNGDCDTARSVTTDYHEIILTYTIVHPGCDSNSGSFTIESITDPGPWFITIDGGNMIQISAFPYTQPISTGMHTISFENGDLCMDDLVFNVNPPVEAFVDLGPDQEIHYGDAAPISIQTNITPNIYTWNPSISPFCDTCLNTFIQPEVTTTYALTLSDGEDCMATDSVTISVRATNLVYIPTAFSPNGDGVNDVFTVYGDDNVGIVRMQIFNRWGDKVWERERLRSGSFDGWDGMIQGKRAQEGVYVYLIELQFANIETQFRSGEVTLVR